MAKATKPEPVEPGTVDELVRIIALQMRHDGVPQGVLVHDLTALGFPVGRIALLLDTSPNTVSQQKRQKRPKWPTD